MRFLLLTGLSGAGKTSAIRYLEDLGAFCVDNLPPMMIPAFMSACSANAEKPVIAVSVDARSGSMFDAYKVSRLINTAKLDSGYDASVIFFEATEDVLVQRYKESRRDHPLSSDKLSLPDAIARERQLLMPLRETAAHVIDTTDMKPRALKERLRALVSSADHPEAGQMIVEIMSFGFKRGLPKQADLVFDVRFLPNPYYIPELGHLTGLDEPVRDFVLQNGTTQAFIDHAESMLDFLLPRYRDEGKMRLTIAIGCTGGAHRSVAITERLAEHLRDTGCRVFCSHRDLKHEQAYWADLGEK